MSVLFTTSTDEPRARALFAISLCQIALSSLTHPRSASTTSTTMSAPAAAARERSTPIFSTSSSVSLRMPAVSKSVAGSPPMFTDASTTSRVVPSREVTIERSLRVSAFNKRDLPTFGRPTMATVTPVSRSAPRLAVVSTFRIVSRAPAALASIARTSKGTISSSKSNLASSSANKSTHARLASLTGVVNPPRIAANALSAAAVVFALTSA
mmetsp:Transcript_7177/g.28986  ORF Transcript_7177/g.28986 Transcript_7177/m.28986 type:complete len:211 (-) Transcript_7177:597-1229(-)